MHGRVIRVPAENVPLTDTQTQSLTDGLNSHMLLGILNYSGPVAAILRGSKETHILNSLLQRVTWRNWLYRYFDTNNHKNSCFPISQIWLIFLCCFHADTMTWKRLPKYWPFVWETWWRHQMETFSAWLAFCAGNSPVTGGFPKQRPVTQCFGVFFDLRPNKWLSKQWRRW